MANEFDKIKSEPTLPPITIMDASKSAMAQEFADALRRGYTIEDIRVKGMAVLEEAIGLAKVLL